MVYNLLFTFDIVLLWAKDIIEIMIAIIIVQTLIYRLPKLHNYVPKYI